MNNDPLKNNYERNGINCQIKQYKLNVGLVQTTFLDYDMHSSPLFVILIIAIDRQISDLIYESLFRYLYFILDPNLGQKHPFGQSKHNYCCFVIKSLKNHIVNLELYMQKVFGGGKQISDLYLVVQNGKASQESKMWSIFSIYKKKK